MLVIYCYSLHMPYVKNAKNLCIELVSLSTPRARLCFWALATTIIFLLPYRFFENLSLWQRIGWDSAPSIGLTRAYWLLIHGDIAAAWERNSVIFVVIAIGIPILIMDAYKLVLSKNNKNIA